jgi:hypothetical protein
MISCRRIRGKRESANRTMLGMDKPVVFSMRSNKGKIKHKGLDSVSCRKPKKNTITIQRVGKISNMICWRTGDTTEA